MTAGIMASIWRCLLVTAIATITVVVLLGVAARYIFNTPLLWTGEAARIALIWMMFIGITELFRIRHGHVAIGVAAKLPFPRVVKILQILAGFVVVMVLLAMMAGGLVLANPSRPATSAALGIPMWILYAVIPASGIGSIALILLKLLGHSQTEREDQ